MATIARGGRRGREARRLSGAGAAVYVLGGRAMVIAYDEDTVIRYMKEAVEYSQDRPVLIDHFLEDAIEVDVDALSDGEDVVIAGIMQHIEEAGIHSGDSSCVLPAVDIPARPCCNACANTPSSWRGALKVIGLMNIQFAIPRTSDSGRRGMARRAAKCMCSKSTREPRAPCLMSQRQLACRWRRLLRG